MISLHFFSASNLPSSFSLGNGPSMSSTPDGKNVLLTRANSIYYLDCKLKSSCKWTEGERKLKLSHFGHIQFNIPANIFDCYSKASINRTQTQLTKGIKGKTSETGKNRIKSDRKQAPPSSRQPAFLNYF